MRRVRLARGADPSSSSRRSILDDRLTRQFCDLIKRGLPPDGVCDYLGLSPSTFWLWMKKGESYLGGNGQPKSAAAFGEFVLAFRKATAEYRLGLIDQLHSKTPRTWVRDMTVLERRDRRNFSRYDQPGGNMDSYDPDERFL